MMALMAAVVRRHSGRPPPTLPPLLAAVTAAYSTAAAGVSSALQQQPPRAHPHQHLPLPHHTSAAPACSRACSSDAAAAPAAASSGWQQLLPAVVRGWLRRYQRGQAAYPATPLTAGSVSPRRRVPHHLARPDYAAAAPTRLPSSSSGPGLGSAPELQADEASRAAMRRAGQLAARALALAGGMARPGVTTDEIDAAVHEMLVAAGAYPSPLGYHGFPKSVCTSVNEVVCHGVPDSRPLADGDVINIDVTAYLAGFHGDTNATFAVGTPSDAAAELLETTRAALQAAIDVCGPGVPFRAIGAAVERVAVPAGLTVIRGFVGHGIGRVFHAAPPVLHHRNLRQGEMQLWQTFTIEPILSLGSRQDVGWAADPSGWTRVTADGALTAQFEHTLMVTEDGCEVLTQDTAA